MKHKFKNKQRKITKLIDKFNGGEKIKMRKKGNIGQIPNVIMLFVIAGVVAVVGLEVITDTRDEYTSGTTEYLAASNVTDGLENVTTKFPLLGTVTILGVIIATIVGIGFVRSRMGA